MLNPPAPINLAPSAEEANDRNERFVRQIQVVPESPELQTLIFSDAISFMPSAVGSQVTPESADVYIWPPSCSPCATAVILVPSADTATAVQESVGALVCVQVWAKAGFAMLSKAHQRGPGCRKIGGRNI